jgi:hypothetical protein
LKIDIAWEGALRWEGLQHGLALCKSARGVALQRL